MDLYHLYPIMILYSSNTKNFIDLDLIESGVSKKDKSIMSKVIETLKDKAVTRFYKDTCTYRYSYIYKHI